MTFCLATFIRIRYTLRDAWHAHFRIWSTETKYVQACTFSIHTHAIKPLQPEQLPVIILATQATPGITFHCYASVDIVLIHIIWGYRIRIPNI